MRYIAENFGKLTFVSSVEVPGLIFQHEDIKRKMLSTPVGVHLGRENIKRAICTGSSG
ncbi:hypothetical protein Plhal304r1_c033g0104981 [Plasmopara halstedii]